MIQPAMMCQSFVHHMKLMSLPSFFRLKSRSLVVKTTQTTVLQINISVSVFFKGSRFRASPTTETWGSIIVGLPGLDVLDKNVGPLETFSQLQPHAQSLLLKAVLGEGSELPEKIMGAIICSPKVRFPPLPSWCLSMCYCLGTQCH